MRSAVMACLLFGPSVFAAAPPADWVVAWGKPVSGLQAGIRAEDRTGSEVASFRIVVRNVGGKAATIETLPTVFTGEADADGVISGVGEHFWGGLSPRGVRWGRLIEPGATHRLASFPILPFRGGIDGTAFFGRLTASLKPGAYRIGSDRVEVRIKGRDFTLSTGYLDVVVPPSK